MSKAEVKEYNVVFEDILEDKSLAEGAIDLVLNFTTFVGDSLAIFDFNGILVDEIIESEFVDYLKANDQVIPDLRSRSGTTATFMVQTYKRISQEDGNSSPFDVVITPVGIGHNVESTLLYSIANEDAAIDESSFNPSVPFKFEKDEVSYGLIESSYFQVDLGSKKLTVRRNDRANEIFRDRVQKIELLHPDALVRTLSGSQVVKQLEEQYDTVRNLVLSVEDAALSKTLQDAIQSNTASLQRVAALERSYQKAAHKAKNRAVLTAIASVAQFGLNVGGYVQQRAQVKAHQAALEQDRDDLKEAFDDLNSALGSMQSTLVDQGEKIDALNMKQSDRGIFFPMFDPSALENMSEFYDGQQTSLDQSLNTVIKYEMEQTPNSFKIHYERTVGPQLRPN